VDSGATHNFVDKKLVKKMNWAVADTPPICIKLGDGSRVQAKGACQGMEIEIGGVQIEINAQLFDLGGVDVVLGVEWMSTLGDTIMNWRKHTMSFWYNKEWITFQGLNDSMETLNSILSSTSRGGKGWLRRMGERVGEEDFLNTGQQRELEGLLSKYEIIFQEPKGLPPRRKKEHMINLKESHEAVNVRPYRYPHHHKNEIEKQVKELLEAGVIRHSTSSFSSSVILVKKKDGSWRMCIDYRALNKATIPDKFPIPVIEELLDELHGATVFSKLDLKSGYHQVRVKEEDVYKTAFRTHEDHYEFLVMPFGLMNPPSTFQSLMNEVFRPILRKFVLVFFDDILVYSKDWKSHMSHLEEVLSVLQLHGLVANKKKCQFAKATVDYLGHVISGNGVAVDPTKIESVTQTSTKSF
jgi:predicted aspartyl protease